MPTFGGNVVSRGVGAAGATMARHPTATGFAATGANIGLGTAGAGAMEAKMLAGQQQGGMQDLMQNWRSRMPTTNPMMAGGGMNPNYQFA